MKSLQSTVYSLQFTAVQLVSDKSLPHTGASPQTLSKILTQIFIVVGALAFLMMVIAGFRYVISQGQPEKVAEIKRQIIYAFIGLIIAASAAAIVNFVLGRV